MPRSLYVLAALPAFALLACSGAQNQDLFEATAEQDDTAATQPSPPGKGETGAPTAPPAAPNDPATDAPEACTQEDEPNDDAAEATPFSTGLCGEIESSKDVDYGSFVVPLKARSITWSHTERDGKASYRFFLGNVAVPMLADDTLQAVPGATYLVQIRRSSNTPTYELSLTFN